MNISVSISNDWRSVDAEVLNTLMERGSMVVIHYSYMSVIWSVEVPEWRDYLSAVWHVYAKISRGSVQTWPLRCKRQVAVNMNGRVYQVRYWVTSNGIQYGSISM